MLTQHLDPQGATGTLDLLLTLFNLFQDKPSPSDQQLLPSFA